MKAYQDFRHGAEGFQRDMQANVKEAFDELIAVCTKSTDPAVTAHCARWKAYSEFAIFLSKPRKESDQ